jgi:hypothetical protein
MGKKTALIVVAIAATVVVATAWKRVYVLKPEGSPNAAAVETEPGHLIVSGGLIASALEIHQITQHRVASSIFIRVYLRPVPPSGGGPSDFRVRVVVPDGVNEVWLGDAPRRTTIATVFGWPVRVPSSGADRKLLWKREMGRRAAEGK